jgi:hypothetical protein
MRNPGDIITEPSNIDVDTLKNLGPLTEMAGIWEGSRSLDIPLRYHTHIVKPGEIETLPPIRIVTSG